MNSVICAIEQEMKYTQDFPEQNKEYRRGYQQALEAVSQFLILCMGGTADRCRKTTPTVKRLLSFTPPSLQEADLGEQFDQKTTEAERSLLEITLKVLRYADYDTADFLNWWLHTYGPVSQSPTGIHPDWPKPSTEAELDELEAHFDRWGRFGIGASR